MRVPTTRAGRVTDTRTGPPGAARITAAVFLASLAGAPASVRAAEQTVHGRALKVKDPKPGTDPARRRVVVAGKQTGGAATLVGDPSAAGAAGGAVVEILLAGATPSRQAFVLAQGARRRGGDFWTATSKGFRYDDPDGERGAVRSLTLSRGTKGTFTVKAKLEGRNAPLLLAPPAPGTDGCVAVTLGVAPGAGDRYSLRFGPDGRVRNTGATGFSVKNPTAVGVCGSAFPDPATLDCPAAAASCPELSIPPDAPSTVPGMPLSPFRGFADPSIRRDPASGRLWVAYSWPHLRVIPGTGTSAVVDIHLAHSDDGGATWTYDQPLWTSADETDAGPSGGSGFSSHEVATLAPVSEDGVVTWYAAHLRYHVPAGGGLLGRRADSFHFRVTRADTPPALGSAPEGRLGGSALAPGWAADVNLSSLAPDVAGCQLWNEPALHAEGPTLYLAAQCLAFGLGGVPLPAAEHVAVFATEPAGLPPPAWTWRRVGRLAGQAEAAALGGQVLHQIDLARGRDGALLALVSPTDYPAGGGEPQHRGCRVLRLASLDPPLLLRDAAGAPRVRASVTASDLDPVGPGACGYEPTSATGLLFVRRVFDFAVPELVWTLHRTGLHP